MRVVKAILLIALGYALCRLWDRYRNRGAGTPPVIDINPRGNQ